jgi:hypothetical protein
MLLLPLALLVMEMAKRLCSKRSQSMNTHLIPSTNMSTLTIVTSNSPQFTKQSCAAMCRQSRTWPPFGTTPSRANFTDHVLTIRSSQARVLEHLSQHDLGRRAVGECQTIPSRLLVAGIFAVEAAFTVPLSSTACVLLFNNSAGPGDDKCHQQPVQRRQDTELAASGDAVLHRSRLLDHSCASSSLLSLRPFTFEVIYLVELC